MYLHMYSRFARRLIVRLRCPRKTCGCMCDAYKLHVWDGKSAGEMPT
jgi:hypothetical protein